MVSLLPSAEDDSKPTSEPEAEGTPPTPEQQPQDSPPASEDGPAPEAETGAEIAPEPAQAESTSMQGEQSASSLSAAQDAFNPADPALAATIPPPSPLPDPVETDPGSQTRVSAAKPPPFMPPALDERNFPADADATPPSLRVTRPFYYPTDPNALPQHVDETDIDATRVTPAAYQQAPPRANKAQQRYYEQQLRSTPPERSPAAGRAQSQPERNPGAARMQPQPERNPGAARMQPEPERYPATGRTQTQPVQAPPVITRSSSGRRAAPPPASSGRDDFLRFLGCFGRTLLGLLVVAILIVGAGATFIVIQYYSIARTLPDVESLKEHASKFETTRILDRNGNVLYEILDPNAGRRTFIPIAKISPYLIATTIATEDKDFYNNPGFDPIGIARAFWQNYTSGQIVSGASTITQQLARTLLLSPEEANQRTYQRKIREIVLAAEITRKYTKDEILELYLNENNYGNMSYGIQAAAETYFNSSAGKLNLAQASFLAGLPQAPSVYDIFTNREETLRRNKQVLVLTYELSREKGCIEISTGVAPVCVDAVKATDAAKEIEAYRFQPPSGSYRYPHWVNYIRVLLEQQFDPQTIYRSGFTVYTTLDPNLQDQANEIVQRQVGSLAERNATNGALVAIRPASGEILAMVGSADFNNADIAGQINMALVPRQPGSSIKPLTYLAAFEKGWTPSTLIWDVPSEFPPSSDPNDTNPDYEPVNYDGRFHGPVTVRSALANSYNIPAVTALQFVGIFDDANTPQSEGLIGLAKRMGITTLTRSDYGLALTLGGGDVTLLEMTSAFSALANNGRRLPPVAITKITDFSGNIVYEYKPPAGDQVVRPEHAYLITSILSDNDARTPMFGPSSVLALPFQAAAKTGTTNDFRDNWTMGYTPDVAVGVWVGNADYTPMEGVSGLAGAAPIWSEFIQNAEQSLTGGEATPFIRPAGVVERVVCTISGAEPSEWCPSQRSEIFAADQPPLPKSDDLWKKANIDTWTGLEASADCSGFTAEKFAINVQDFFARQWIRDTDDGRAWADSVGFEEPFFFVPDRACKGSDPRPNIYFAGLSEDQTITSSPLDIYSVVDVSSDPFGTYRLEWGEGNDPGEWKTLVDGLTQALKSPDRLFTWDIKEIPSGDITLRIYLEGQDGHYAEKRLHIKLQVPTPTPTVTPTPTMTPTITLTPTPTQTPTPTLTPSLTPSETPTLPPEPPTATLGA